MNHHDDNQIDARLCDVPVPVGIAQRVAPEALFDDAAIDRLLVGVSLPPGLSERVRQATAAMRAGAVLPLPSRRAGEFVDDARRTGPSWRRMRQWPVVRELLADGAAVAVALSIVALMFFAGTELSRRLAAPAAFQPRVAAHGQLSRRPDGAAGAGEAAEPGRSASSDIHASGTRPPVGDRERATGPSPRVTDTASGNRASAAASAPVADSATDMPRGHGQSDRGAGGRAPATAVEVRAAPGAPDVVSGDRGVGAIGIRTVLLPLVGRQVPRVPAYDIAFEMAHGESPFIDPAASVALSVDRPPLSLRTDSFDGLREASVRDRGRPTGRRSRRGGMPTVRVEEVLAAVPAAAGEGVWPMGVTGAELRLSLNAVRSLRPLNGSMFVEVCASAPPLSLVGSRAESAPLDVMLVLDQSTGPFAPLSWQWLCRALGRVIDQMGPADRLSLVVCGERPRLAALRADAASLSSLLPELMREPAARSADFDAAFRLVAAVGQREGRPDRIVAAAHAASLERCRKEGHEAFSAWQAEVAAASATPASPAFVLIEPQESLSASGSGPSVAPLGAGRIAADPIAISRGVMAQVFERPTQVATGCRLEVAFDPGSVGSYRIVGHRQTAADALASIDQRGIELHAGETTRVVYEVIRRPGDAGAVRPGWVSATLAWTPTVAGPDGRSQEQKVRTVLADGTEGAADLHVRMPSPHGCELLLAVALGELAAASIHADPWRQSVEGIAGLASRWQARGDVTPLGWQLIDCLKHQGLVPDSPGR